MSQWNEFYQQLNQLTNEEKKRLYQLLTIDIPATTEVAFENLLEQVQNTRFTQGLVCPFCSGTAIKRNGKTKGHQRYLCHTCQKTFGDTSSSILTGTHYREKWLPYLELMLQGLSLRKIAVQLHIHLSTAFYWRHKILLALSVKPTEPLSGIVEADETYLLESQKGKNSIKKTGERKARKRGGVAKKRGISREQVSILVAVDRNGEIFSEVAGFGRISSQDVDELLHSHLQEVSCFCSDAATNFINYAKENGFEHQILNAVKGERVKKGIYHIQHVNAYHKRLKEWLVHFNGVATKYLNQYLVWFRYLEQHKNINPKGLQLDILTDAFSNSWHIKTRFLQAV